MSVRMGVARLPAARARMVADQLDHAGRRRAGEARPRGPSRCGPAQTRRILRAFAVAAAFAAPTSAHSQEAEAPEPGAVFVVFERGAPELRYSFPSELDASHRTLGRLTLKAELRQSILRERGAIAGVAGRVLVDWAKLSDFGPYEHDTLWNVRLGPWAAFGLSDSAALQFEVRGVLSGDFRPVQSETFQGEGRVLWSHVFGRGVVGSLGVDYGRSFVDPLPIPVLALSYAPPEGAMVFDCVLPFEMYAGFRTGESSQFGLLVSYEGTSWWIAEADDARHRVSIQELRVAPRFYTRLWSWLDLELQAGVVAWRRLRLALDEGGGEIATRAQQQRPSLFLGLSLPFRPGRR